MQHSMIPREQRRDLYKQPLWQALPLGNLAIGDIPQGGFPCLGSCKQVDLVDGKGVMLQEEGDADRGRT